MASRRFKSPPYVRRQWLAFREFGEIRAHITGFRQNVWIYEDGPPMELVGTTVEVLLREREKLILGELDEYDAYTRSRNIDADFEAFFK